MIDHYNAFISYRHSEKDSAIAAEVQHRLERYKLPRAIQKRTGLTKLGRVFRDKEELPITSDLNDDISFALEHSDFLIVICSVRTKESVWVEREIRYFLKTHSKKQVLTVLVDGEPYDVIPQLLLNDEVEVLREDGTKETVTEAIEPLSCDYRIPIRRARREELPRLAAALLGCSYDELVERERQYRRHRIITIASAAGVVLTIAISYLIWSLVQIRENYELAQSNYELAQENYELAQHNYDLAESNYQEAMTNLAQSQRNQSRNLANQSLKLLDNNNRIDAILLALAALPGENNDRPLVAEAEFALAQAVGAYVTPATNNIDCAWNYDTGATVVDFKVSAGHLLAWDSSDRVYCWDISTHELCWSMTCSDMVDAGFLSEEMVAIVTRQGVQGVNTVTGEQVWQAEGDYRLTDSKIQKSAKGIYMMESNGRLDLVDPGNGEILQTWSLPEELEGLDRISISNFCISPGETKAFLILYDSGDAYRYGVMDLENNTFRLENKTREYTPDFCMPDDETIVVGEHRDIMSGTTAMGSYLFISESTVNVECLNADTLQKKWSNDMKSSQLSYASDMFSADYTDFDGTTAPCVVFYVGEKVEVYRTSDGKLIGSFSASDPIIEVFPSPDGDISILTMSGQMGSPMESYGTTGLGFIRYFAEGLDKAKISRGAYVHKKGTSEIIYYSPDVHDEDMGYFEGMTLDSYISDAYTTANYVTCWDDEMDVVELYVADAGTKELVYHETLEGVERNSELIFLGEKDGNLLYCYTNDEDILNQELFLLTVNPAAGTSEAEKVKEGVSFSTAKTCAMRDGLLYFVDNPEYGKYELVVYDMANKTMESHEIPTENSFLTCDGIFPTEGAKTVFLDVGEDSVWYLPETGTMVRPEQVEAGFGEIEGAVIASDDSALVLHDKMILAVFDRSGKMLWKLDTNGIGVLSVYEHNGILYAALADESLRGYRLEDGTQLGTADAYALSSRVGQNSWYMDDEKGLLYVTLGRMTTVVDTERWMDTCVVALSRGYCSGADIFAVALNSESGSYSMGWFDHYSVDELKEKAKRFLGDTQLTEEKKLQYGLE